MHYTQMKETRVKQNNKVTKEITQSTAKQIF